MYVKKLNVKIFFLYLRNTMLVGRSMCCYLNFFNRIFVKKKELLTSDCQPSVRTSTAPTYLIKFDNFLKLFKKIWTSNRIGFSSYDILVHSCH